jgi:NADP-dependent 3-hydroxy acid dehydrogenase YdfG
MTQANRPFLDKWILITGATSGIGRATAERAAELGANLVLVGRREERLAAAASDLARLHGVAVEPVRLDIADRAACAAAYALRRERWDGLFALINNAGLARGTAPLQSGSLDDFAEMIDVNVKGLLYLTRPIAAAMAERRAGHIVNLGSVAGRWVYPGGAVYCATKFSVRALSEGLRLDLAGTGVRVTNVEPGMVETEFSEVRLRDAAQAKKVYEGMSPLAAEDVADAIAWCLTRPARVNVQELVLFPTDQAAVGHVARQVAPQAPQ